MKYKTFENTLIWLSALALPTFATFILFSQINNQKTRIELAMEELGQFSDHPDLNDPEK